MMTQFRINFLSLFECTMKIGHIIFHDHWTSCEKIWKNIILTVKRSVLNPFHQSFRNEIFDKKTNWNTDSNEIQVFIKLNENFRISHDCDLIHFHSEFFERSFLSKLKKVYLIYQLKLGKWFDQIKWKWYIRDTLPHWCLNLNYHRLPGNNYFYSNIEVAAFLEWWNWYEM